MSAEQFKRVAGVMEAILEAPEVERTAILDRQCAGDAELRARVESLLKHLDRPAVDLDDPRRFFPDAAPLQTPQRIGAYRILGVLGEGGMGVVYLAQQDRPKRHAALKVIRPGLLSPDLLSRFKREAELLGRLHHPGIAQIYEAGVEETDSGPRPYFAMECVAGAPLLEFAEREQLDLRARVELFIRICQAVQHAHAAGVIHRDLKPGNILVERTAASGAGGADLDAFRPRILDFGVARLTDAAGTLAEQTLRTEPGQLLGTLRYMSPEQVAGAPQDVDSRSDIYALGVILYELLTGRHPLPIDGASLPETARLITEGGVDPPGATNPACRGDLDTIVGKTLEKEPHRRYASVAELAADLRRCLDDQPIVARQPSTLYQLRKFARRNRVLVSAAAAVVLALLVGVAGLARGLVRARQERTVTEAVNAFLADDLLANANPFHAGDPDITLRQTLDRAAEGVEDAFAGQPRVAASLHDTIGTAYYRLGEYGPAETHLRRAVALYAQEYGEDDERAIESMARLGTVLWETNRYAEAEPIARHAVELARRELGPEHKATVLALDSLAVTVKRLGRTDEAETLYREALDDARRAGEDTFTLLNNLAVLRMDRDDDAEAEKLLLASLDERRARYGERHPYVLQGLNSLGDCYWREGKLDEAEKTLRAAYEGGVEAFGPGHPDTLRPQYGLALVAESRGDLARAAELYRETAEGFVAVFGEVHRETYRARRRLADALVRLDRRDEAETQMRLAYDAWRAARGPDDDVVQGWNRRLWKLLLAEDRADEARPLMVERLAYLRRRAEASPDDPKAWNTYAWQLATCEPPGARDPAAALPAAERAVALGDRGDPAVLDTLATVYFANGRVGEAVATEREALGLVPPDDANRSAYEGALARFTAGRDP